ncbi:MAG: DUF692 domain-containing protein [Myxococcota bacterium]|nr:DUF692 family protein [Deltaproteobacteria bacterium]MDQ3340608.1 DUF692 domain-containing protein [Myxococcota bacterium]
MIHVGFSLFDTEAQRIAALPLLEAGAIDALEWTIDLGWQTPPSAWVAALLDFYASEGRLYGHGVGMSPTSARLNDAWLARFAGEPARYRHVTEHWGWSRARGLVRGAPMPLPACDAVVEITARALRALADRARAPVGLENLALAMSQDDVDAQPAMLARVLDATDGVLLLDLHNVWCQAVNFERDVRELVAQYPLERVRQLHVAGGSWSTIGGTQFRRDTHDALVPEEVMDLVAWAIPRCSALEAVILERIPDGLGDQDAWRAEFTRLAAVVRDAERAPRIAPPTPPPHALSVATVVDVARFQDAMIAALLAGGDVRGAILAHPGARPFRDEVSRWDARAIEVAVLLAARWSVTE